MRLLRRLTLPALLLALIAGCAGSTTTGGGAPKKDSPPAKRDGGEKEPETQIIDGKEVLPEPREKK